MNRDDMTRLGLTEDEAVTVATVSGDGVGRKIDGLRVHAFDIPAGCAMGYYPECNPLIPLAHHAKRSKVPAAKAVPVTVRGMARAAQTGS
jgi:anaerobic selenocysteine-containing dehydrogenase